MGMPYCIYRTVTFENVVSNIVEILNDIGIECEIETYDETSSDDHYFYGVKMKDSNIRLVFHISKTDNTGYGKNVEVSMQAKGGYLSGPDSSIIKNFGVGGAYNSLTVSIFFNSKDFYIISFSVSSAPTESPVFSSNQVFKFGKIKISDITGINSYPVCSIGGPSSSDTQFGFHAFKFINDEKERIISSKDAIKICPMIANKIKYLPVDGWNIFVYPVVAYSSGQYISTNTDKINVMSDEIIGMKTVYGSNLPLFAPLLIDGKTYVLLDSACTAVQID